MNNRKFSATMGTRLAILMVALLAALAALAAGQALSAQPAEAICPQPPCKPVSQPVRQPTETGSDERRSQNVSSSGAKRGSPNSAVHRRVTREEAKRALKYWTQKRMANAIPVSSRTDRPGSKGNADQPLPPNSSSRPTKGAAPVLPSDHPDNRSRRSEGSGVITPYQDLGPDIGQQWTGPSTRPPATVNGVLFFKTSAGALTDRRCSASTVNSPAKNLVFTAGRCVHRGYGGKSGWYTNFVFVPGYREGSEPYGRWAAMESWSINAWIDSRNVGYDVGAVVFYPKSGVRLVDVVGGNGIAFNYPAEQYTYTFGYPSRHNERLYYCSGTPVWNGVFDPKRMSLPCDFPDRFNESQVGGPWVMRFGGGELGYLHSVTSDSAPLHLIDYRSGFTGILFENAEENLFNTVRVRY